MPRNLRFNRNERIALSVVALAVCGALFVTRTNSNRSACTKNPTKQQLAELRNFTLTASNTGSRTWHKRSDKSVKLSRFDPNRADSSHLARLGLPIWVVRNIIKYRKAGGKFHKPDDVARIYGMTADNYHRVAPYIDIREHIADVNTPIRQNITTINGQIAAAGYQKIEKLAEGQQVDLNCGDTSQLKRVPGIGSTIANRIISYGKLLGGFVSPKQVNEVYGVAPETDKWFFVSDIKPKKINVNAAAYAQIIRHPYINKAQTVALLRYRDTFGRISDLLQLRFDTAFTDRDIQRLLPYVEY